MDRSEGEGESENLRVTKYIAVAAMGKCDKRRLGMIHGICEKKLERDERPPKVLQTHEKCGMGDG